MEEHKVQTPHFPLYSQVSELLVIFSGTPKATVRGLINATNNQMGTPQNPVDWSDPTLQGRLGNLVERGLVLRAGNTYTISPDGVEYAIHASAHHAKKESDTTLNVYVAIKEFNTQARDKLRVYLSHMPPYRFEHLIRDLLEAMGYEDVTVTKESGDRGVDVVATVQFGITTITEVVQVKRHKENINRPVLDQLRGALPYYKALRGTIITLGSFSKGCIEAALFPGAAPIGLIDGEKLLDLLTEHKIGVKKQSISLDEVDEGYFKEQSTNEEIVKTLDAEVTTA